MPLWVLNHKSRIKQLKRRYLNLKQRAFSWWIESLILTANTLECCMETFCYLIGRWTFFDIYLPNLPNRQNRRIKPNRILTDTQTQTESRWHWNERNFKSRNISSLEVNLSTFPRHLCYGCHRNTERQEKRKTLLIILLEEEVAKGSRWTQF